MKKLLLVIAVAAVGMASCKKEEITKPDAAEKSMVGKKTDMGEWE